MGIPHTFWGSLLAMRLHCNMRVQVVEGAIGLLTSIPSTFVHALDFFVSPARSLVLLCAWNWYKRVDGRKWVSALLTLLAHSEFHAGPHSNDDMVKARWNTRVRVQNDNLSGS
jgi:hypothetical protein